MAEILDKFRSVLSVYPWNEWTDGKPRRAVKGRDFTCTARGFIATMHARAKRIGMVVSTAQPKDDVVDFQFTQPVKGSRRKKSAKKRPKS